MQAGPKGTADYEEWSPGWLGLCACQLRGPPHPD